MAVDEFGREIPGSRGRNQDRSSSPGYGSPSRGGGGTGDGPSYLSEALPTSRYGRDREDRGSGGDRGSSRKRKHHDSESPPPSRSRGHRNSGGGGDRGSKSESSSQPHPSTLYSEEPMMCQYLWKEANKDKKDEEYEDYRRKYCLNYVRTFFNVHLDDSWFRSLYSPLGKYRVALQEQDRAKQEAQAMASELEASISKNTDGPCFFVLKARLGGGIKQSSYHNHSSPSKSFSSSPHKTSTSALANPVPGTHVLASASQVLPILDVPHYVTDEQLTTALASHCDEKLIKGKAKQLLKLYSSSPGADLSRTAYLHCPEEVRKDIIHQLNHLDRAPTAAGGADGGAHVPRKEDTFVPKTLELEVECTDAYGRTELDADGKGGAPEEQGGITPRKASVWVSTLPLQPTVKVLSAAVSSRDRILSDKDTAIRLAKAYDTRRGIPMESRLETILPKAIPGFSVEPTTENGEGEQQQDKQEAEDALDIAIAYLRRVHLFSFYNGCTTASNVADVFNGTHSTSTIHLRLGNADELLQKSKEEEAADVIKVSEPDEPPKVDLLVQRLNKAIEKAMETVKGWSEGTSVVVDEEIDRQAKDIEEQESKVEGTWIEDHALVDEDGRARCSFHFCRKLFKDSSFLKKHLMKKHSEFLRAEMAKCHDSYMMKAWDTQEQRPVPPILVDCGRAFSTVPTPVLGAAEPLANDPEPELWRRQEERAKIEQEEQEARRERYEQHQKQRGEAIPDINGPLNAERTHTPRFHERSGGGGFEDVDDMKEEKIEMAFDAVDIPVMQPPKKKKKKKKLL